MKQGIARHLSYAAYPPPLRTEEIATWAYEEFRRIDGVLRGITAPQWDDQLGASVTLRLPPSDPAAWDEAEIAISFSGTANQQLQFSHQFTHRWWEEDPIRPHLHVYGLTTATAGANTVRFEMRYKWYNVGDAVPAAWTYLTATQSFTVGSPPVSQIIPFGTIAAAGKKVSSIFKGSIWRLATNASDTYTATTYLDYQDVHLRVDSRGSYEEYVKTK